MIVKKQKIYIQESVPYAAPSYGGGCEDGGCGGKIVLSFYQSFLQWSILFFQVADTEAVVELSAQQVAEVIRKIIFHNSFSSASRTSSHLNSSPSLFPHFFTSFFNLIISHLFVFLMFVNLTSPSPAILTTCWSLNCFTLSCTYLLCFSFSVFCSSFTFPFHFTRLTAKPFFITEHRAKSSVINLRLHLILAHFISLLYPFFPSWRQWLVHRRTTFMFHLVVIYHYIGNRKYSILI